MLKRLELPEGRWADLIVEPSHADYVAVLRAQDRASNPFTGAAIDWKVEVGRVFLREWNLLDDTGQPIPVNDWAKADPRLTMAVCDEAIVRWTEWEARRPPLAPRTPDLPKPEPTPETPSGDTSAESG